MNASPIKQRGFAMPAMFLAVAIAFFGGLNMENKDGITVAQAMGLDSGKQTEFAAMELHEETDSIWVDE